MSLETNKAIKFPDQHYVGYRADEDGFTGFMTPYGTDAQAKKRMGSVDSWVDSSNRQPVYANMRFSHYEQKDHPQSTIFDNVVLEGFKIESRLNRGGSWYGSQDKWKIDDPRGFVLEISGSNLQKIIEYMTIKEGVIQGQLIWGRLGAENILVPVNSEIYEQAKTNTIRHKTVFNIKDMFPGDKVLLQDGTEWVYQGQYYTVADYGQHDDVEHEPFFNYQISKKKTYIFYDEDSDRFRMIVTPKVSAVVGSGELCCELRINSLVNSRPSVYERRIMGNQTHAVAVTSINKQELKPKLVRYTKENKHGYVIGKDKYNRLVAEYRHNGDASLGSSKYQITDDLMAKKTYHGRYEKSYENDIGYSLVTHDLMRVMFEIQTAQGIYELFV